MVIIQLAGGLGNQMFQYALYLQLQQLGKHVKIDETTAFVQDEKREPSLSVFGINYEKATVRELEQMLDSSPLLWHKIRRKLCGRKKKAYFEENKLFHPDVLKWDDIYLEGYWQTEKYFKGVESTVRQVYDMDRLLQHATAVKDDAVVSYLSRIDTTESVSVHVRGGDYLLPQNTELFGGICTKDYYRKAMEQIRKKHPDCTFFLFTNDKEFAKTQIDAEFMRDMTPVELPAGRDCEVLAMMSRCRHNILSNSSFSWWASYLNRNPDKLVLAPDRWLNGWDCRDYYREDMTVIGR